VSGAGDERSGISLRGIDLNLIARCIRTQNSASSGFEENDPTCGFWAYSESVMDIPKILKLLREDLAVLKEAIVSLERLEVGRSQRRGRPPDWLRQAKLAIEKPKEKSKEKPPT
jgi:hypothetical protein